MSTSIHIKYLKNILSTIFLICLVLVSSSLRSENLKQIISLEGTWKFTIGDNPEWANKEYNDSNWDYVYVPKSWENNGFNNYNGFAWYRKNFQIKSSEKGKSFFLVLGKIDDVDEVYLNGHLIGATGVFPPLVRSTYDVMRKYYIPDELIDYYGSNLIAVRIFDDYASGGIYDGPIGIYYDEDNKLLSYNLAGYWDFEPMIKTDNNASDIYGQEEGKIYVPGYWESYGYTLLDASAVYSKSFMIPYNFESEEMMIVLGYIDDVEKVYFNDELIGTTDNLLNYKNRDYPKSHIFSAYDLPSKLFIKGGSNSIKVKVYDTGGLGGIYEGPIGLISKSNFQRLKKNQSEKVYSIWDEIYKSFFE